MSSALDLLGYLRYPTYCLNSRGEVKIRDAETGRRINIGYPTTVKISEPQKSSFCPPIPVRIICNGPATIVFWNDETKTVVKKKKGEKNDPYTAFSAALAKKIYGSTGYVKSLIKSTTDEVY